MKKAKTITQIGYVIKGIAYLRMWGGGTGNIQIKPVYIPFEKFSKTTMLNAVNDNGFGCEKIFAADIDIFIKYDNGSEEHNRTLFDINDPIQTQHFGKRGI